MSDSFAIPPDAPAVMTPSEARDIARVHKWLAENYADHGMTAAATRSRRESDWWLAYAMVLSATGEQQP